MLAGVERQGDKMVSGFYRRICVLVQPTSGGTYAVDFFWLAGGHTHHYGFYCNRVLVRIQGADFATLADAGAVLEEWSQWIERPHAIRSWTWTRYGQFFRYILSKA